MELLRGVFDAADERLSEPLPQRARRKDPTANRAAKLDPNELLESLPGLLDRQQQVDQAGALVPNYLAIAVKHRDDRSARRALLREDRTSTPSRISRRPCDCILTWVLRRPHSRPGRDGALSGGAFPDRPRAGTDLEYRNPASSRRPLVRGIILSFADGGELLWLSRSITRSSRREIKRRRRKFFARMFGLEYKGAMGHFAAGQNQRNPHFGFRQLGSLRHAPLRLHVSDVEFDAIFAGSKRQVFRMGAVRSRKRICRSITGAAVAESISKIPNGHLLELLTRA